MIDRRFFLAAITGGALGCRETGPFGYPGMAFIATEGSSAVTVVDLRRFRVTAQIKLDSPPAEVIAHATEPRVYALGPKNGTVYELNATALSLNRRVKVADSASSMKMGVDGASLWVFSPAERKLVKVRLPELRPLSAFSIPPGASDFDISQHKGYGAVSHADHGSVTLLDLEGRSFTTVVQLGGRPQTVRFRSDGEMLLVANTQDRVLTSLRMPGGRVVSSLPLAVRPDYLCFNQDNGQLFITGEGADAAVVVYPFPFPQVAETVLAGSDPGPMAASSQYLFVANPRSGDVSILDIPSRKVIAVAAVGSEPAHIVITPSSEFALVLNRRSGDMAVLRIGTIRTERDKRTPILTIVPVGSNPRSAAVRMNHL